MNTYTNDATPSSNATHSFKAGSHNGADIPPVAIAKSLLSISRPFARQVVLVSVAVLLAVVVRHHHGT